MPFQSRIIPVLAAFVACSAGAAPITVTSGVDATTLANALGGSGITISNPNYSGATAASGTFTGGAGAGLSIDSGIILSTGLASSAGNAWSVDNGVPNTSFGTPGSPLLSGVTNDAAILTFDLTTNSTTASFNYFFASGEYVDFVYSFNDQFSFFISGPGISGMQNIALVPGTTDPVSINTVNGGGPNASVGNSPANSAYFINNLSAATLPDFDYDGLTTMFTATASGLVSGETYTLTLVIADAIDTALDSAVFIQAGSLTSAPPSSTPVPEPESIALFGIGLVGLGLAARRRQSAR